MAKKILDFRPEHDGFQFTNSWRWTQDDRDYLVQEVEGVANEAIWILGMAIHLVPIVGDLVVGILGALTGLGPFALPACLGIAIAAGAGRDLVRVLSQDSKGGGMCGGMTQAAMDYWNRGWIMPGDSRVPGNPDPNHTATQAELQLRTYIRERLADTLRAHLVEFLKTWVEIKDKMDDAPLMPFRARLEIEYDEIKARIDRGELVTVGVLGNSTSPESMHQVLCYGYKEFTGGKWSSELCIYDPNAPRKDIRIKLSLWKAQGDKSEIWTNMSTTNISPGYPNWLAYLFAVDYIAKTPPRTVSASPLRIKSSDGINRLRRGMPVEIESDISYHGPGNSLTIEAYLKQGVAGSSAVDVGLAQGGPVVIPSGKTHTVRWKGELPGAVGSRRLELLAHRTTKDSKGKVTYTWRRAIRDSSGNPVATTVDLRDVPSKAEINWSFGTAVPQLASGKRLSYPISLSVSDALGAGASYQWAMSTTNASGTVTPAGSGRTASAEVLVNPQAKRPPSARFEVRGRDSALYEVTGSVEVPLPRANAWLEAIRSQSVPEGNPRMRNPQGPGWIGQKAIMMQAYSMVMLRLHWSNLVGIPTKVEWVFSDDNRPRTVAPGTDLSAGWCEIPVSTMGGNDPLNPLPQHSPKPVVVECKVMDAAGQTVTVSRKVDPWFPAAYFVPGKVMPFESWETYERFMEVLPEARQRLMESFPPNMPGDMANELEERTQVMIEEMASGQVGEFRPLVEELHPDLHSEDPIFDTIGPDEEVLRLMASDRVLLNDEAKLVYDVVERTEPQMVGDVATVGVVDMLHVPQVAPETELGGAELLAELGFER